MGPKTRPETEEDASRRCISCAVQQLALSSQRHGLPAFHPARSVPLHVHPARPQCWVAAGGCRQSPACYQTARCAASCRCYLASCCCFVAIVDSNAHQSRSPANPEQKASRIGDLRWRCVDIKVAGVALLAAEQIVLPVFSQMPGQRSGNTMQRGCRPRRPRAVG